MPYLVERWKCSGNGCRFVRANKDSVEDHEKRCWLVKSNKTCLSCKFHEIIKDSDGSGYSWKERHCNHPIYEAPELDADNVIEGEQMPRPVVGCKFWEVK